MHEKFECLAVRATEPELWAPRELVGAICC